MDPRTDASLIRRSLPLLVLVLALAGCEADSTSRYLVMIGTLFVLGAAGEGIFKRTQIPDVVWLILAGIFLRVTGLIDPAILDPLLPLFSTLTLIVLLFDGGRQIVIADLIRLAPRAGALALLSFTVSTIAVAIIVQLAALTGLMPEAWTFTHSLMTGAILGGTSTMVLMPSMNLAKIDGKVTKLVGLESALTDALCVVVAVVLMKLIVSGDGSNGGALIELSKNFGIALLLGTVAGWAWMPVLRALAGSQNGYAITLAALLFLTATVQLVGGNAPMAVLTFSVVVGNAEPLMKMVGFTLGEKPLKIDDTVVTIHNEVAFVVKAFFFTYMGLKLEWHFLLLGVAVGVGLFAARGPAVRLIVREPDFQKHERKLVAIALPRGMAAGVLATLPMIYGVPGTEKLTSLVFAAVVTTIAIFAVRFPKAPTAAEASASVEAGSAPVDPVAPDAASAAMPDGWLPEGASVTQLPSAPIAPTESPRAIAVAPSTMPDGQPSAEPAKPASFEPWPPG